MRLARQIDLDYNLPYWL